MGGTMQLVLRVRKQGAEVEEEVESLRRWVAEHVLTF